MAANTNMEEVITEEELGHQPRAIETIPRIIERSIDWLYYRAVATPGYYEVIGEPPIIRMLRMLKVVIEDREGIWTHNESLDAYLSGVSDTLDDPTNWYKLDRILWYPGMKPCSDVGTHQDVVNRFQYFIGLARTALDADDPQLAVSIIRFRLVPVDQTAINDIPLLVPAASAEANIRHPTTEYVLIDSGKVERRMAIHATLLKHLVNQFHAVSRAQPDGWLHKIPPGVLSGQSNHEARQKALDRVKQFFAQTRAFRGRPFGLYDQILILEDMERSWLRRVAFPYYRSILLPPPIDPDTPATHRFLNSRDTLRAVRRELRHSQKAYHLSQERYEQHLAFEKFTYNEMYELPDWLFSEEHWQRQRTTITLADQVEIIPRSRSEERPRRNVTFADDVEIIPRSYSA